MTKRINSWWKKISVWNKVRLLILPLAIGGEVTLIIGNAWVGWQIIAPIATILALYINLLFEDKNNNGIVDMFEKKKPK